MLKIGEKKIKKIGLENLVSFYPGDSEKLNFQDHRFDAVIVAFGVRNFENLSSGINEIFRVIKPGGVFVVLEFSIPGNFPVKQLFNFYFFKILPVIGRIISKDKSAYSYLPASVKAFPDRDDFLSVLNSAGFVNTKYKLQSFGIAAIYWGTKN
jgi:demethylmenaquinone methyltransferase/2-methoxy-6-polyprenyl-1,4-benzoquinol methylase